MDVYHDTFPLPPYGGRIFVTIPFFAPEQVGNFVYHCHILSHEDTGMMAVLEVDDPAQVALADQPSRFASLAQGAMCGVPPAPRAASFADRVWDAVWSASRSAVGSVSGMVGGPAARWSGLTDR